MITKRQAGYLAVGIMVVTAAAMFILDIPSDWVVITRLGTAFMLGIIGAMVFDLLTEVWRVLESEWHRR